MPHSAALIFSRSSAEAEQVGLAVSELGTKHVTSVHTILGALQAHTDACSGAAADGSLCCPTLAVCVLNEPSGTVDDDGRALVELLDQAGLLVVVLLDRVHDPPVGSSYTLPRAAALANLRAFLKLPVQGSRLGWESPAWMGAAPGHGADPLSSRSGSRSDSFETIEEDRYDSRYDWCESDGSLSPELSQPRAFAAAEPAAAAARDDPAAGVVCVCGDAHCLHCFLQGAAMREVRLHDAPPYASPSAERRSTALAHALLARRVRSDPLARRSALLAPHAERPHRAPSPAGSVRTDPLVHRVLAGLPIDRTRHIARAAAHGRPARAGTGAAARHASRAARYGAAIAMGVDYGRHIERSPLAPPG